MNKTQSPIRLAILQIFKSGYLPKAGFVEIAHEQAALKPIPKEKLLNHVYNLATKGQLVRHKFGYKITEAGLQSLEGYQAKLPSKKEKVVETQQEFNFDASAKQKAMLLAVRDAMEEQHNYRKALIEIRAVIDKYLDKDE